MLTNPQESADLLTFTEEILNGKLLFLCSGRSAKATRGVARTPTNIEDGESDKYSKQNLQKK